MAGMRLPKSVSGVLAAHACQVHEIAEGARVEHIEAGWKPQHRAQPRVAKEKLAFRPCSTLAIGCRLESLEKRRIGDHSHVHVVIRVLQDDELRDAPNVGELDFLPGACAKLKHQPAKIE